MEYELGAGDVVGNAEHAFLIIDHEECGLVYTRAICLTANSDEFAYASLIPYRDGELAEFFNGNNFTRLGLIDSAVSEYQLRVLQRVKNLKKKKGRSRAKK